MFGLKENMSTQRHKQKNTADLVYAFHSIWRTVGRHRGYGSCWPSGWL